MFDVWSGAVVAGMHAAEGARIQAKRDREELEAIEALPHQVERLVALAERKERKRLETEERRHREIVAAIRESGRGSSSNGAAGFLLGLGLGAVID